MFPWPWRSTTVVPVWVAFARALMRADIGETRRLMRFPEVRSSTLYRLCAQLLDEKRGRRYLTHVVYAPPLPLLWSFRPHDKSPAGYLHHVYCRVLWRERSLWGRTRLLSAYLVWPFIVLSTMAWATAINGPAIARRSGKIVLRQLIEQVGVAIRHGILPHWYYILELFDDSKRRRAGEYLHRYETKGGLYRLIKRAYDPAKCYPLNNKRRFAEFCRAKALPIAAEAVTVDGGVSAGTEGECRELPPYDLFLKPLRGRGGEGAESWCYLGDGQYRSTDGEIVSGHALLERLRRGKPYIVQARLTNHKDMKDLSNGALATVRIMTILDEGGRPEATHAVLRMAVGDNHIVDNFHAGGIAAPIEIATGVLGRATDIGLRPDRGWYERHPDTDGQILGRRLPLWRETIGLAVAAHAAFAGRALIGWDIAITDDGPILVEGNGAPDVDLIQRPYGEPLGNSRFGVLLAFHLQIASDLIALIPTI